MTAPGSRRWPLRICALGAAAGVAVLATPAAPAAAHPLGNFSVNQYVGLAVGPEQVRARTVVNTAEVPTLQDRRTVDRNRDGTVTDAERRAYTASACARLADGLQVAPAGGPPLTWTVVPGDYTFAPGAGGLATARLTCTLNATLRIAGPTDVTVVNRHRDDQVGWHEMTAVGTGVQLSGTLPARTVSEELLRYPAVPDPASLVNVRTASIRVAPGTAGASAAAGAAPPPVPAGDPLARATGWAERSFERLAAGRPTPLLGLLTVVVAVLLGAGHAVLPGHGKTVLAAYLAGRAGRPRDAVVIGATVTATHTAGVLAVGLLVSTSSAFAGDRVLRYLSLASGVVVIAVGIGMLVGAVRQRRRLAGDPDRPLPPAAQPAPVTAAGSPTVATGHGYDPVTAGHTHQHGHPAHGDDHPGGDPAHRHPDGPGHHGHSPGPRPHGHPHGPDHHGHTHGFGHHGQSHGPGQDHHGGGDRPGGRLALAGIGIAGGLVPSPSALVVLLAAVALGQAMYGVLLVVAYGLGMAATLTAAGLLLLAIQRRSARAGGRLDRLSGRLSGRLPVFTAGLVAVVGVGLTVRAAAALL